MTSGLLLGTALLLTAPSVAQTGTAPYTALGTEPFWSLTIAGDTITYRSIDGRPVRVATPRPIVGINGELYRARGMTVDITHVRCSDGMSDRTYADTVRVTIGRQTLSGCGGGVVNDRAAGAALLANTRWRIAAIDGRPVRIDRPATVAFTGDRITGRICNGFGGGYRYERGRLTTRDVIGTQMACPGGATEIEAAFLRVLSAPSYASRGSADTLVLTGGRNTVTLRRDR